MALSNMEVFNKYYMPAIHETLDQMIDKFNGSSNGAIRLTAEGFEGDFMNSSFYTRLVGARRRVDRYGTNGDVAAIPLAQGKHTTVKVAGGYGPVIFEPAQMTWLQKPTAEGVEQISSMFAEDILQDMLNSAISALVAGIGNQGDATTVDVSSSGEVTYTDLNHAHALFGDHSASIVAHVMDGRSYHNFIGQNLANQNALFQAGNVRVVDVLGRPAVVTDAPALFAQGSGSDDPSVRRILALTAEAATVHDERDMIINIETKNGKQRIETTWQADYTFGLGLKGYAWDETNGGASPTDAELSTGSNWDLVAASIKHTAGVMVVGQA